MEFSLAQSTAANEEKGGQMVASELEAAEALAGLARFSALHGGALGSGELERQLVTEPAVISTLPSQDRPIATQHFCGQTSTTVSNPEKTEKIVQNIPSKLCSTSSQSNSANKFRRNLMEAEKEARKLRRVMANRESARQTIRRRQAMYLELTRKATDLLEENENLKKQKELSVEKYNSLKSGNEFLKTQLAKVKKPERAEIQEESATFQSDKSCSLTTSTPAFFHKQPSTVPCFWPSGILSLDVFQSQCASQFRVPHRQENSMGITGSGTPLFVFPVPWSLSFLTYSSTLQSNSGLNVNQNAHHPSACTCSGNIPREDNIQLSSDQNRRAETPNLVKNMSCSDINVVSAPGSTQNGLLQKNQKTVISPHKKSQDVFAATEARRRRKELMKLKNVPHPVQRCE